jgi:hypothetical protein
VKATLARILAASFQYDVASMATCPRCGGFLHEQHHCAGPWRFWLRTALSVVLGGIAGLVVGWLVLVAVDADASWLPLAMAASVGIVIALALHVG